MKLILGDCLEKMKDIPDGSVDLVLTDPPYGIGVAEWDKKDIYDFLFAESMRVLKQGCYAFIFSSKKNMKRPPFRHDAHDALEDVRATRQVFYRYADMIKKLKQETVPA